ncbi:MAG: MoxR family ATPase [Clostridiales bacterium]|nr:MoxR family ATPase [Clostridiales bacterium]
MNIKRAKNEIKDTIEAYLLKDEYGEYVIPQIRQRPVLLLGAPGIGKTQIMEQVARECEIGLVAYTITHHTRQSAIGLPSIAKQTFDEKEYAVTEYTMSEIVAAVYRKIETTGLREGILFIDEINCVSETLAPAMLQFLQCKTFGNHEVPQGWIIVAAGNPPEYNKSVREFDVVTMDRVKKIEVEPDYTVWKEYAQKEQIHPAILSYLDTHPASFYKMETTVDGRKFATPRSWEDLSTILQVYEVLGKEMDREVVIQYIQHDTVAKDFANYLELYHKYQLDYQLEAVLSGHIDEILLKKASHAAFDERLSVVSLLLASLRESFAAQIRSEAANQLLYEQLNLFKNDLHNLPQSSGSNSVQNSAQSCFAKRIAAFEQEYEQKKTTGLLSREDDRMYREVLQILESYKKQIYTSDFSESAHSDSSFSESAYSKKTWPQIKEQFSRRQDTLEESFNSAAARLEYAFDFVEAAFGSGQEMVIFITNLNLDYYCVRFLQQYECERYYQYNKELLFDERSRSIEARLNELNL